MAKLNPFDVLTAAGYSKEEIVQTDADYPAFMVNRGFSYFQDTLFYANEMNRFPFVPGKLQFDFYRQVVRPRKRFSKWAKTGNADPVVEALQELYGFNRSRAEAEALILTDEEKREIIKETEIGGRLK